MAAEARIPASWREAARRQGSRDLLFRHLPQLLCLRPTTAAEIKWLAAKRPLPSTSTAETSKNYQSRSSCATRKAGAAAVLQPDKAS